MKGSKIRGIIMLALVICCPIVLGVLCAGAVFGWYTHIEQVGELHGDTSNVNLHYYINDSEKLNPTTLSVSYITFFDIDAPKETRFLNDMCNEISLDVTNKASSDADVTIRLEAVKSVKTASSDAVISRAYVGAIGSFGTSPITGTIGADTTIVSKMTTNVVNGVGFTYVNNDTVFSCEYKCSLAKDASINDLKFFVFGVQDIDGASLADFYYAEGSTTDTRTYAFKITLRSVTKGDPDIVDITTTEEE